MSHEINKTHYDMISPRALALGAFFALAVHETSATMTDLRQRRHEPEVISTYTPHAKQSGLYVPGYHANGAVIGDIIGQALPSDTNWHVVHWDESGFRPNIAGQKVYDALARDDGLPLRVHVSSMGFHPFSDWMNTPQFRDSLQGRDVRVTGSSNFFDISDIDWKVRASMYLTRILPPIRSSDRLFKKVMGMDDTDITVHENGVDDHDVERWKQSSANAPYGAARGQVSYMLKKKGNYPWLAEAYQGVNEFRYISARNDQITNPYSSFAKIRAHLGEKASHWTNIDYPDPSHAMEPAFRSTLMKLMFYSDDELADVPHLVRLTPQVSRRESIIEERPLALAS